jgi:hypothetical protein
MANTLGYQGQLFIGTAGSQAPTQVQNCEDLNYDNDLEKAESTVRGDGLSIPKKSEDPVCLGATVTWSAYDKGDAALISCLAAARTGALIAIRTKNNNTGLGFDGDMSLVVTHEMTLKGIGKFNFTGTPSTSLRTWSPNV